MKPSTTQKEPFYKFLKSKTTQGEWKYAKDTDHPLGDNVVHCEGEEVASFGSHEVNIPNAQYTTLAVNNLDKIADALTEFDNAAMRFADDHKHYYEKGDVNTINAMLADLYNAHLKAKEALNRIS